MDMLQTIAKLCSLPGVTGDEQAVGEWIRQCFLKYTQDVWQDRYGNVYGRIGEKVGPEILVMAHMDEIGLMVTGIEENGHAAHDARGWGRPARAARQRSARAG